MSIFKGNLSSSGEFTAQDDVRGLRLTAPGTAPAYFSLETADGVKWYLYINDSDEWIMHTSAPTVGTAGIGNIITGAGNSGANTTLSNLGTVAIATDILAATDSTYDLGGTNYWAKAYIDAVYLSSTSILTGGVNVCTFTGGVTLGVDGTDTDLICYGETATQYMQWDGNAYSDAGALFLKDNVRLGFGAASATTGDIQIYSDGTNLAIEAAADDVIIKSGAATDVDWQWESKSTAGQDMGWIADIGTFQLCDDTILNIGGATVLTADDGFTFVFDGTATLNIDAVTAQDSISIGENVVTDFELFGNAYDIIWDASADELIFGDNVEVIWGAGKDLQIESNGTLTKMTFGATTAGIEIVGYAAQTVAALRIDGTTNTWNGANDVGMLTLDQDAAMANAGASMLMVKSSATPIAAAEGFLARFVHSGTATASSNAVEIEVPATQGALGINGKVTITGQDSMGYGLVDIVNNSGTDNKDGVTINTEGTGFGLKVIADDVDSVQFGLLAKASQTSSMAIIDGQSVDWIGNADNVGMVSIIHGSTALAHAGGTMLYVASSAQQKAAAEGSLARFLCTGNARADAAVVEIAAVNSTEIALNASAGRIHADGYRYNVYTAKATNAGDGTGLLPAGSMFVQSDSTSADDEDILMLAPGLAGDIIYIYNTDAAQEFIVTPNGTETLNGGAAGVGMKLAEDEICQLICATDGVWVGNLIGTDGTYTAMT